jgi:hypothetical protein
MPIVLAFVALGGSVLLVAKVVARDGWPVWPATGVEDRTESRRFLALLAVVAVPVASVAYFTSTSGFFWDDLVNFRDAQVGGLDLLKPSSSHFAPGHRLGDWLIQHFFPMNFRVAQALMLVGFAATLIMFHRLLAEFFGAGPGPLLLTLAYGVSTIHVGTLNWWASGLDRVPATFLTFVSITAYVRFVRTGARRSLVASLGAMAVALLFYVKPVLVPVYLILLRVLVLAPHVPLSDSLRAALREWRVWLAYAVPAGLYLLVYVRGYDTLQEPSLDLFARYLSVSWFQVVGPALLGIYIPKSTAPAVAATVAVAAQVVLAAVVVWSLRRTAAAWRAWAFFAVAFVLNAALVGFTRVGLFSPRFIAYVLYYHLEARYLFLIALGAVVLGVRTAGRQTLPPGVGVRPRYGQWARPALAGGLAVYLALSWWGAGRVRLEYTWFGATARQYMTRADDGLDVARGGRPTVALVDGTVPYRVVPDLAGHYNSHSEILPLVDDRLSFDAADPELFEVADDGAVRPVAFVAEGGGDVSALMADGSLEVVEATAAERTASGMCVRSGATSAVLGFTPRAPRDGPRSYLSLRYSARSGDVLALVAERVGGGRAEPPRLARIDDRGSTTTRVFPIESPAFQRLFLVLTPEADVCLDRLEVGRLVPR